MYWEYLDRQHRYLRIAVALNALRFSLYYEQYEQYAQQGCHTKRCPFCLLSSQRSHFLWFPTCVNQIVLGEIGIRVHISTWVLKLSILLYYEQVMLLTILRSCLCLYFKNLYYCTVVRLMYFGNSCIILLVLPEICEFKKTKLPYATVFPASAFFSLPVESISTFFTFLKAVDLYLFIYLFLFMINNYI